MSKRTERMSRSAAERINRKDTVIRQNNAELEELRESLEELLKMFRDGVSDEDL